MNKNKGLLKAILLLIGAILFPFFVILIDAYITFEHPGIKYNGEKSVPKEDVIHYGKITLRDLRMDECAAHNGNTHFVKYYIIKKNHFSERQLDRLLSQYCSELYNKCYSYDMMSIHFYMECSKMPWYWNDGGHFPSLYENSDCEIGIFWISKDGIGFHDLRGKRGG